MSDLVLAKHVAIGGRKLYEDRVEVSRLQTAGGLQLAVAIVADGVGGEAMGERASQITLDSILNYLPRGTESTVPELLARALHYANQQVFRIAGGGPTRNGFDCRHRGRRRRSDALRRQRWRQPDLPVPWAPPHPPDRRSHASHAARPLREDGPC
jgi:hypothetical protein